MSQIIVNHIVAKAKELLAQVKDEPKLTEQQQKLRELISTNAFECYTEKVAKYTEILTGFNPLQNSEQRLFSIWVSKKGNTALMLYVSGKVTYGIVDLDKGYADSFARPATTEEATTLLNSIATCTDAQILRWINDKVGSIYAAQILDSIDLK